VGEAAPYDGGAIREAIERLAVPEAQREMRRRAAEIGPRLSDAGIPEWLDKSVKLGHPADDRFERLFAGHKTASFLDKLGIRALGGEAR
jgi:hypothetical protein